MKKILMILLMSGFGLNTFADVLPPKVHTGVIKGFENGKYRIKDKFGQSFLVGKDKIISKSTNTTKPVHFTPEVEIVKPSKFYKITKSHYKALAKSKPHLKKFQEIYTQFLIGVERKHKPQFTSVKTTQIQEFMEMFAVFEEAYATAGDRCFFGGWVSKQTSTNKCRSPWKKDVKAESKGLGLNEYDSTQYCDSKSSNYFRCNPMIFGEVSDAKDFEALDPKLADKVLTDKTGGLCVKAEHTSGKSYTNLTQRCRDISLSMNVEISLTEDQLDTLVTEAFAYCQVKDFGDPIPSGLEDPCEPLLLQLADLMYDITTECEILQPEKECDGKGYVRVKCETLNGEEKKDEYEGYVKAIDGQVDISSLDTLTSSLQKTCHEDAPGTPVGSVCDPATIKLKRHIKSQKEDCSDGRCYFDVVCKYKDENDPNGETKDMLTTLHCPCNSDPDFNTMPVLSAIDIYECIETDYYNRDSEIHTGSDKKVDKAGSEVIKE